MTGSTNACKYAPERTALVVVDMQNDFCAPGGYIDRLLGRDMTVFEGVAAGAGRLIAAARAAGVPVVWLAACYEDPLVVPAMRRHREERGIEAVCCARGTWGHDWFRVAPAEGEAVVEKHCFSGFGSAGFAALLERLGVDTLVFAGVQTNVCVESTLREAHSRGYHVAVAEGAVGSHSPEAHQATLANVRFLFGEVLELAALEALWRQETRGGRMTAKGGKR